MSSSTACSSRAQPNTGFSRDIIITIKISTRMYTCDNSYPTPYVDNMLPYKTQCRITVVMWTSSKWTLQLGHCHPLSFVYSHCSAISDSTPCFTLFPSPTPSSVSFCELFSFCNHWDLFDASTSDVPCSHQYKCWLSKYQTVVVKITCLAMLNNNLCCCCLFMPYRLIDL